MAASVGAMDLKKCGEMVEAAQKSARNGTNSTTTTGLHLSREECIRECGGGLGNINWGDFSQNFGAWFLPWIALAFQIPFGGERPWEDIQNFFMTIGSPALAAYSLQITHLNTAWLSKKLSESEHPNHEAISTVISAFQHIPIELPPVGSSLPSLIGNNAYWAHLHNEVKRTRRWSIPLVVGFVWVILAALLTIVDSFASPPTDSVEYSIVAAWTFLLPLIMGWLYVGSQSEPNQLKECLSKANKMVTGRWNAPFREEDAPQIWTEGIGFMKKDSVDGPRKDELIAVPVFNYTRAFIWALHAQHILSLVGSAAENAPVAGNGPGDVVGCAKNGSSAVGDGHRDGAVEHVIRYYAKIRTPPKVALTVPPRTPFPTPILGRTPNSSHTMLPIYHTIAEESRWAPGIWGRVALAALFALALEWGTVGAAVSIHYWQPPVGLGCRTLSFLLYGAAGSVSMFFCLAGSILAHISRPLDGQVHPSPRYLDHGASFCVYMGKTFAFISGIGIIIICSFHSSGVYNNCTCASTTFDRGVYDVVILAVDQVVGRDTIRIWICGLAVAFATAVLFGVSIYVVAPKRR